MAIPKYDELFLPFLMAIKDGKEHKLKEIIDYCACLCKLTDDERNELTSTGSSVFSVRVGWARTYLKKAGLVVNTAKGVLKITEEGLKAVNSNETTDIKYLQQFESFKEFVSPQNKNQKVEKNNGEVEVVEVDSLSPQERIENSIKELNSALADDLMEEVMKMSCYSFERFVIQLLVAMGYGSALDNDDSVTKKSGDGGIDGVLKADKFGFDSIYIQAKQWKEDSVVGSPDIQKFAGSMSLHGALKGLFITTAKFSKEAVATSKKNPACKIVLIDGKELAKLMIEYDIGVSTTNIFKIKKVDSDFFADFD